jgi:hypothetical protein
VISPGTRAAPVGRMTWPTSTGATQHMIPAVPRTWLSRPRDCATAAVAAACIIAAVIVHRRFRSVEKPLPPAQQRQHQALSVHASESHQPQRDYQHLALVANKKPRGRIYLGQVAILASLIGAVLTFSALRQPDTTPPPALNPAISNISIATAVPHMEGKVFWVATEEPWGDAYPGTNRSLDLFVPLVPENCSTYVGSAPITAVKLYGN